MLLWTVATFLAQIADPPAHRVAGIAANYTEAQAGPYTLPDPLKLASGKPVKDAKAWNAKRRPEIVRLAPVIRLMKMPVQSDVDVVVGLSRQSKRQHRKASAMDGSHGWATHVLPSWGRIVKPLY